MFYTWSGLWGAFVMSTAIRTALKEALTGPNSRKKNARIKEQYFLDWNQVDILFTH